MQDKKSTVRLLRAFSIVLFLFAMGVFGARMFGGLDISPVIPMGLVVIGFSLLAVSSSVAKSGDKPD